MKIIILVLVCFGVSQFSQAQQFKNSLSCSITGTDTRLGFSFDGEILKPGVYSTTGSYRIMIGSNIVESATNVQFNYKLVLNKNNYIQIKNFNAQLGRSGVIQILIPSSYEKSKVKSTSLSLYADKPMQANCDFFTNATPRPGISGSN